MLYEEDTTNNACQHFLFASYDVTNSLLENLKNAISLDWLKLFQKFKKRFS